MYEHLELIVVGDGCSDDTEARVAAIDDPRRLRLLEPGDWNRLRRMAHVARVVKRHPEPLARHYQERSARP